ncbi:hypothetical protein TNIN_154991 [Trichonephila inaurata madagascariensis]|uniref:Uncharacterized protein n=1 Tax=Trichonephila inaurata madagascariensis TaxID=2747483 RepID=A0A8X6YI16_9ARAC|nr:hypothetical protein TNIN_154991 [Trichonephila inaurata madagascariensis]
MRYRTVRAAFNPTVYSHRRRARFDDGGHESLKVDILDDTLRESRNSSGWNSSSRPLEWGVLNFRHRGCVMRTDIMIEDNGSRVSGSVFNSY